MVKAAAIRNSGVKKRNLQASNDETKGSIE